MKNVFIINPAAGKGTLQEKIKHSAEKYFEKTGTPGKTVVTTRRGEGREIAEDLAKTGENVRIFACGGEGTVFEVLNGIVGHKNAQLGVLPCGSANDFLKFFGEGEKEKFLDIDAQINGDTLSMDVIKANDDYCINGASVGMDAMVARDMILFKRWPLVSGAMAYKLSILKNFLQRLGVKISLSVDGNAPEEHTCLFAVAANAPYYGGGYMSAPDAVPYDNTLDFTLVDKISKLAVPKFLSLYEKGKHGVLSYCHLKKCQAMEFWSKKPIPVNLDGEIKETTHMAFSILKNAVDFVVPRGVKTKLITK